MELSSEIPFPDALHPEGDDWWPQIISQIMMTEPPHRRGTLDYLLIWTCEDMILFSHGQRQ